MRGPNPLARSRRVPRRLMYEITALPSFKYVSDRETEVFILFFSLQTEVTSPTDSEDRTPGRLQAVWPPPKPRDEEEKVGLRYTEAGKSLKHVALHAVVCVCIPDQEC